MRILLVHPHDLFSSKEPWTIRVLSFANCLRRMGHDATVAYFPRTDEKSDRPNTWQGVPLITLDRRASPGVFIKNLLRLIRLAGAADVVHVQKAFHWAAVPAAAAAYVRSKPFHYDWDDWEEQIYLESAKPPSPLIVVWLRLLERWILQLARTVSVSSERLKKEALSYQVSSSRIWWAPVGADTEQFHPDVDPSQTRARWNLNGSTVLYLGQLHGGQYVELLLGAAALVQDEFSGARFLIVGDGHERRELEEKARILHLSNVTFVGSVSREEVPSYVAAADVCVAAFEDTPVTRCKSPLKIAEYLAAGKPVVASDVGEVPRMLGEAGRTVPAGSASHLAQEILQLLRSPDQRKRLSLLARSRSVQHFAWHHSASRLADAYAASLGIKAASKAESVT